MYWKKVATFFEHHGRLSGPPMRYVSSRSRRSSPTVRWRSWPGLGRSARRPSRRACSETPAGSYFTWDLDSHRRRIIRAREQFWPMPTGRGRARIVLDEIHKYPRWKRFLKGLFDTRRDELEIIVVGSGRLDVYQKGGDSLLGRYGLHRLHPFTVGELLAGGAQQVITPRELDDWLSSPAAISGAAEALAQVERFTGFPEPLFAGRVEALRRWRRMRRALVLREDLRDLTRIRELGLIDQMVELLPERVGSPLSINALREDLGVAFDTGQGMAGDARAPVLPLRAPSLRRAARADAAPRGQSLPVRPHRDRGSRRAVREPCRPPPRKARRRVERPRLRRLRTLVRPR